MTAIQGLKGADLSCELCGIKMQSPFILSSGPLSYAAEGMIAAHQAGAGAVVTKTIRLKAAINPTPHIGIVNADSLINCEKWADTPSELWFTREIPMAKAAGAVVIASVGHTLPEAEALVKPAQDAGADMIELVSYTEDTLLPMLQAAKARVSIPVICKLSGNWPDPVGTAKKCMALGADAISAIDSIGPTLKIDIKSARPEMNSDDGYGWLSGAAMRPIAMRIVSEIARNGCNELVGIGGISKAEDAVEYLMAGAQALGICSSLIIKGMSHLTKVCKDLALLLDQLGYKSLAEVKGAALATSRLPNGWPNWSSGMSPTTPAASRPVRREWMCPCIWTWCGRATLWQPTRPSALPIPSRASAAGSATTPARASASAPCWTTRCRSAW